MSQRYADMFKLKIGQKVLYPNYIPYVVCVDVVTVKDVRPMYGEETDSELVMHVEEFDGYINPLSVYTKEQILEMFESSSCEGHRICEEEGDLGE